MEQMDIYMRRRLIALGGLIGFFIIFVLLVKSCGGDDPEPTTNVTQTGASGESGTSALPKDEFIAQADAICAKANSAVGSLDPADTDATSDELRITTGELEQLQQLEAEDVDRDLRTFLTSMKDLVDALESKTVAIDNGDTAAGDEAQSAIDTAEVDARGAGEDYGFTDCGQFLDAGEGPGDSTTDTGTVAPSTDTGGVAPTTQAPTTQAPTTQAPTTQAPTDDTGGITP